MSGVAVIRSLLAANAPVLAVVPAIKIKAGILPLNIALPTISVTQISSIPRNTLSMNEAKRMHTDRVQVTVLVADTPEGDAYPGMRSLLALVLAACPNQNGTVNGVDLDSILPDIEGPDFPPDASGIHEGSRDFIVKWRS
jgi:hypothetical protein